MPKMQLPPIGGIRKVLKTQPQAASGTTIAEVGSGTISLATLAALITQIQAQQQNNGGGNIGDGTEAFLQVGPGLSGGGPMLGTVQLRLTGPIPALLAEDGADGDPGPPGRVGVDGKTGGSGPAGPAVFILADDGDPGDMGPPGPPGPLGATGPSGGIGPAGPLGAAIFLEAEPGDTGDPGPPGPQGPIGATGPAGGAGSQGPPGAAIFLDAEAGADGDVGPPGPIGPQGARGLQGVSGMQSVADETWTDEEIYKGLTSPGSMLLNSLTIVAGAGTRALTVSGNGGASTITASVGGPNYAIRAIGASGTTSFTGTTALGISLTGASSTNDFSGIDFLTTASATPQARIAGIFSGGGSALMFGTSNNYASGITNIALTLDLNSIGVFASAAVVSSSVGIKGATPAVTAGQTDIGNTTTATVITTAGGIALPALANTFWVVNLNGVKLGIPAFAL